MTAPDDTARLDALQAELDAHPDRQRPLLGIVRIHAARNAPEAILALAHRLEAAGHSGSADQVLAIGQRNLPDCYALGAGYCGLAVARDDVKVAQMRWMQLARRLPHNADAQLAYLGFLAEHGRFGIAVPAAEDALAGLGPRADVLALLAEALEATGAWARAADTWQRIGQDFPLAPGSTARAQAAQRRADLIATAALPTQPLALASGPPAPVGDHTRDQQNALVMQFENLGHNCEFGLLQRRFGAEPVGLMRFSSIQPRGLIDLLWSRFAGMGDKAVMKIRDVGNEYRIRHPASGWGMHTRIRPTSEQDATILDQQCRHVGYLTRKLIDDLEEPEKILVFQSPELKDAEIDEMFAALQSYGPSILLCVRLATDTHPAGCVEWRTDRLMIAAIDRPGRDMGGRGWDISVEWWLHFCRLALARRTALASPPPA